MVLSSYCPTCCCFHHIVHLFRFLCKMSCCEKKKKKKKNRNFCPSYHQHSIAIRDFLHLFVHHRGNGSANTTSWKTPIKTHHEHSHNTKPVFITVHFGRRRSKQKKKILTKKKESRKREYEKSPTGLSLRPSDSAHSNGRGRGHSRRPLAVSPTPQRNKLRCPIRQTNSHPAPFVLLIPRRRRQQHHSRCCCCCSYRTRLRGQRSRRWRRNRRSGRRRSRFNGLMARDERREGPRARGPHAGR